MGVTTAWKIVSSGGLCRGIAKRLYELTADTIQVKRDRNAQYMSHVYKIEFHVHDDKSLEEYVQYRIKQSKEECK